MVAAKPDCTGQRFGRLTVLEKTDKIKIRPSRSRKNGNKSKLWRLQCDCGNIVELIRGDFDKKNGQRSCGCLGKKLRKYLVDNKRRPQDLTGQRFGKLTALSIVENVRQWKSSVWICRCDCGNQVLMNAKRLKMNYRLDCQQHRAYLKYPDFPVPYPAEAAKIYQKYIYLIDTSKSFHRYKDNDLEAELLNRLIRVAWIIVYRRSIGEEISEEYEQNLIKKWVRFEYAKIDVYHRRITNLPYKKKEIGMDEVTRKSPETTRRYIPSEAYKMLPISKKKRKFWIG
ncbi:MAG: hypothetical protein ACRDBG_15840 [Waterburya sp.]